MSEIVYSIHPADGKPMVERAVVTPVQQDATQCNIENRVGALSARQIRAIQLLLLGWNDARIGAAVGVNRSTVFRWRLDNQIFREELMRRRRQVWASAGDRLRSLLAPALERLEQRLKDPKTELRAIEILLRAAAPRGKELIPPSTDNQDRINEDIGESGCDLPEELLGDADDEHGDSRLDPPVDRLPYVPTAREVERERHRLEDVAAKKRYTHNAFGDEMK